MDLVSSTLERYLKHRFNGTELQQQPQQQSQTPTESKLQHESQALPQPHPQQQQQKLQTPQVDSPNISNGISLDTNLDIGKQSPKVYNLSIRNTQPCCVSLREDLKFLAAGFENSHIHLWKLDKNNEFSYNNINRNSIENNANNPDDSINCDVNDIVPIDNNCGFRETLIDTSSNNNQRKNDYSVGEHTILLAHSGSVYGIKFIKDDDLMLSCSEDSTIRLWCLKTMCNLTIYRGHSYPIWSLDVGPQGLLFATCSMDMTARLWRLDKMTPLRIFCGHDEDVEVVKFHPNEKYIATGSTDATVRLWSLSDGLMVRLMIGHEKPIVNLSFLPNGKILASASSDGIIKLWDLATNTVTSQMTVPATHMISFSPNLYFVSSCGVDNILRLSHVVGGISSSKILKSVERNNFNLDLESSKLIKSQFIKEDKLFVITFQEEENKETNKIT